MNKMPGFILICDGWAGAMGRVYFKYHRGRYNQQAGGFNWLHINILSFALSILTSRGQIRSFLLTLNIFYCVGPREFLCIPVCEYIAMYLSVQIVLRLSHCDGCSMPICLCACSESIIAGLQVCTFGAQLVNHFLIWLLQFAFSAVPPSSQWSHLKVYASSATFQSSD